MSEQDLALAEARLLQAACLYVDAAEYGEALRHRKRRWSALRDARFAYRAALRARRGPPPPEPADEELVTRGMRVVRRLMAEQERTT